MCYSCILSIIPLKSSTKVTLIYVINVTFVEIFNGIIIKNSPKTIKMLELRPLWYIENNDVICVKTRMTIDKMFYKCLNMVSKVKIK